MTHTYHSGNATAAQRQTSRTSPSTQIITDASFVKRRLFDYYDELDQAQTLTQFIVVLNKAFKDRNITFRANYTASRHGMHSESCTDNGIVEGETHPNGKIFIEVWNEIMSMMVDEKQFKRTTRVLSSVIRHELVHREQTTRSKKMCHAENPKRNIAKMDDWVQYYLDKHELRAFAHEMIESLQQQNFSREEILKEFAKPRSTMLERNCARYYEMKYFLPRTKKSIQTTVLNRLRKLVHQTLS